MNPKNFATLPLSQAMLDNLNTIGYTEMTPIQQEALPLLLEGKDLLAQAQTGSGKTAAFGIGLLSKLAVKKFQVQALILCPTRELADQVAKELRLLAKFQHNIKILTLCGGAAFGPQLGSLRHGAHIVVGTPGRILKHLKKGTLSLDALETLVLDEADRMLDMGFIEEIQELLDFAPKQRQTLLFSATYTDEVLAISKSFQKNATTIKVEALKESSHISEYFYETNNKLNTLIDVLCTYKPENVIIFTNTKIQAAELAEDLQRRDVDALAIHGDLEQYDRNDVLVQFANKSARILVATDVAARGLDIKELSMVINYDLAHQYETYTHRIGRTGRAGEDGIAVSLYGEDEQSLADEYQMGKDLKKESATLQSQRDFTMHSEFVSLVIEGGKKEKLRAGDILGALGRDVGIDGSCIGKIDIYDRQSYVAIKTDLVDRAYEGLRKTKIKAKKFAVWIL